jgi:RNA polymerase sigma-32 factor
MSALTAAHLEAAMGSFDEVASLRAYRAMLSHIAPLTREAEQDLARRFIKGEAKAGDTLIAACLPLVVSIALEYRRWGVPLEDIIQQGNIGLLRAAKKFDPSKECRLATYAAYWIRAEIREYVVRAYRVVRLGTTKSERRALRLYRTSRETDPNVLAKASGLTPERVERLLPMLMGRETSLDANTNGAPSVADRTPARTASPEEETFAKESRALATKAVRGALGALNARERLIVEERLMADEPITLQELGDRLGVSKERVRQLEERARTKLRGALAPVSELAVPA